MFAMLFAGQGSQHRGMGAEVLERYPGLVGFASDLLGHDLATLCTKDPDRLLSRTEYTQPAIFVVNALHSFEHTHREDRPADVYLGHSLGEYNALLAAGVFDFETGLRLVAKRGELMAAASEGGMAAVLDTPEERLLGILADHGVEGVDVAGLNTPSQIVIAATPSVLAAAIGCLEEQGIRVARLKVSAPFHSRYMEPARARFAEFLTGFAFAAPRTPVVSNVTARPHRPEETARLLAEQLVTPVRWTDCVRSLIDRDEGLEVTEIGGTALTRMVDTITSGA